MIRLLLSALLFAPLDQAAPESASREQAQRLLNDAIGRYSYAIPLSEPPATVRYRSEASQPCVTAYREEVPAYRAFRVYQSLEGGPVARIPGREFAARTTRYRIDWSKVTGVEPSSLPTNIRVSGRSFVASASDGEPRPRNVPEMSLSVPAEMRPRVLAAMRDLIEACRPAPVATTPFMFVTATGRQTVPLGREFEVTRQYLVTEESDRSGTYGAALALLGAEDARFRISWRSPVPLTLGLARTNAPNEGAVAVAFPQGPQPSAAGSATITVTRSGIAVFGFTQPRPTASSGQPFGSDFRTFFVTIERLP